MEDIIRYLDFYESNVTLAYKNSHTYKSIFGGILSILTFLSIIIITSIFSGSVFSKKNFKIISTSTINQFSSFDFSKLPLLIGLGDNEGTLMDIDERLFNIIVTEYHLTVSKDKNGNRVISLNDKEFEYDNCEKYRGNKSYFLNNTFEKFELSRFKCIKPGQNLTFFGKYKDSINGYRGVRIILDKCNNETLKSKNKNITCYPKEKIENKLLNIKLNTYYTGFNIDHYSFNNNHLLYIESGFYSRMSSNLFKSYEISFTKNIYITDNSVLFNHRTRTEFITTNGVRYDDFEREALNFKNSQRITENTIGVVSFFLDDNEIQHDRSFESILDVFSSLGGIINLLTIIFGFVNKYITRRLKKIDLIKTFLFETNTLKNSKYSGSSKINNIINNCYYNKVIPDKSNSNNNLIINNSKMNLIRNMKRRSFFNKNSVDNIERVIFKNIIRKGNTSMNNKNNIDINFNKNTNKFSIISEAELKEKFKKLGNKRICFYILPLFISKKCDKFNFIEELYLKVNLNLSLERLYIVLKEWIDIKEKILSIESFFI